MFTKIRNWYLERKAEVEFLNRPNHQHFYEFCQLWSLYADQMRSMPEYKGSMFPKFLGNSNQLCTLLSDYLRDKTAHFKHVTKRFNEDRRQKIRADWGYFLLEVIDDCACPFAYTHPNDVPSFGVNNELRCKFAKLVVENYNHQTKQIDVVNLRIDYFEFEKAFMTEIRQLHEAKIAAEPKFKTRVGQIVMMTSGEVAEVVGYDNGDMKFPIMRFAGDTCTTVATDTEISYTIGFNTPSL